MDDILVHAYSRARIEAAAETGMEESSFPEICPWTLQQLQDASFYPD